MNLCKNNKEHKKHEKEHCFVHINSHGSKIILISLCKQLVFSPYK